MEEPDIKEPADPATGASQVEIKKWEASLIIARRRMHGTT
jgi:hypothetical protein